jgi:AraC family transcriptional regulator
MVAIEDVNSLQDTGFQTREIPASTWAIFASVGPMPNAIQTVWEKIFKECPRQALSMLMHLRLKYIFREIHRHRIINAKYGYR